MARFRLSAPARSDVTSILATSLERWGEDGRARYSALLVAAMGAIAADPEGLLTRGRAELSAGVRSFHTRHARGKHGVSAPVHVVYYRLVRADLIEIARVLHERVEPSRHIGKRTKAARDPRRTRRSQI